MAKLLSGRQPQINVGISSYTEDKTTLNVIGKVGIGTTSARTNLDVIGNASVSGVVTASGGFNLGISSAGSVITSGPVKTLNFVGTGNTFLVNGTTVDISISSGGGGGGATVSIGTVPPGSPNAGDLWYNSDLARLFVYYTDIDSSQWVDSAPFNLSFVENALYADVAGIATYAHNAGISTNVIGGIASVTSLNVSGVSTISGNLGIGTTNAQYKLDVDGDINFTGTFRQNGSPFVASRWTAGTGDNIYRLNGNVGIGTTDPTSKLSVIGDGNFTGVVTASSFSGNASSATYADNAGIATYASTAGIATALQNPRTFEITGDIIASPISFNGTGNVSLAATIQPNSVALGSDTTGDYVANITGTSNQITVTSGTGEGSTPTLSVPSQFTAPQDVTVTRDLQVNRNLNVNGNITIGGTSATLFTTELKIADPDIVLGFRTDGSGNDVSNDNTANHGGVALASTEGTPLVSLFIAGIETNPATYKKIMWFKSGTFSGLGTDAWLSNYAVGIGSTQFPIGTRLAAGSVQFTENDLSVVRNINASGVTTSNGFSGNITGTAGTITTLSSTNGTITNLTGTAGTVTTLNVVSTLNASVGIITNASGTNINYSGVGTITTLNTTNLVPTNINSSGIVTASNIRVGTAISLDSNSGIISATSYRGNGSQLSGIIAGVGIQSSGIIVGTGITTLNFLGAGNTFSVSGNTVNISIGSTFQPGKKTTSFTATEGQTTFNVSGGYTTGFIDVFLNGIRLTDTEFTANNGTSVILATGASLNDVLDVVQYTMGVGNQGPQGVQGPLSSIASTFGNQTYYPLFVSGIGSVNPFISTATNNFEFNPSNGSLNLNILKVGTNGNVVTTTAAGLVGIGTTNPSLKLHLYNQSSTSAVRIESGDQNFSEVNVQNATSNFTIGLRPDISTNTFSIRDVNAALNRLVINNSGNIAIGSTNPTSRLHVFGDAVITGVVTATDFNSTSDFNLKTNIKTVENSLETISQLRGVTFNWKSGGKPSIGIVAQELGEVLPELVTETDPKTVNYNGLIGILIEGIKSQQDQINKLREEVKLLKER